MLSESQVRCAEVHEWMEPIDTTGDLSKTREQKSLTGMGAREHRKIETGVSFISAI